MIMRNVKLITLAALAVFALPAILSLTRAESDTERVSCPDGYAWRVKAGHPFAGRFIPCERFDQFFIYLEAGKRDQAEALLIR